MKRLLMVVVAALGLMGSYGAQCEGKTQAGVRCKRDAAEGSRYCIGHANQAKTTAAREKDDGQCWAVTQAGSRCKHKKDGDKDYCRQHAASIKVKESPEQCRAMTYEGKRCTRKPDSGYNYCAQHRK